MKKRLCFRRIFRIGLLGISAVCAAVSCAFAEGNDGDDDSFPTPHEYTVQGLLNHQPDEMQASTQNTSTGQTVMFDHQDGERMSAQNMPVAQTVGFLTDYFSETDYNEIRPVQTVQQNAPIVWVVPFAINYGGIRRNRLNNIFGQHGHPQGVLSDEGRAMKKAIYDFAMIYGFSGVSKSMGLLSGRSKNGYRAKNGYPVRKEFAIKLVKTICEGRPEYKNIFRRDNQRNVSNFYRDLVGADRANDNYVIKTLTDPTSSQLLANELVRRGVSYPKGAK